MKRSKLHKLLLVVMDGVGERQSIFGNAVKNAFTPNLDRLRKTHFTTLKAHGRAVGLPSDQDMGNSEVGHNALGSGQIYDQGAKLVNHAIASGAMFQSQTWRDLVRRPILHFIGLLSDGNVHSHEEQLYALLRQAAKDGAKELRIHVLFDGRDVPEGSGEIYAGKLQKVLYELNQNGCNALIASGAGRMHATMDRYEADWSMVERGWKAHVLGDAQKFPTVDAALAHFRGQGITSDQYLPTFVVTNSTGQPQGPILDEHAVVLFNFRGDRAIEISKAFEAQEFFHFERVRKPDVLFAGMTQYDGDEHIPKTFLVNPPEIQHTLSEFLVDLKVRLFACSETQKFGHVTYFWNGNRTGYFNPALEKYYEVLSDIGDFHLAPWMKAKEITQRTIQEMSQQSFDFGRINFANGDMVGHTGDYVASVIAVETVDLMIGHLLKAAHTFGYNVLITADHGNCDEMFDTKEFENWKETLLDSPPKPKTSHTLAPVPCYLSLLKDNSQWSFRESLQGGSPGGALQNGGEERGLANIANTVLELMGMPAQGIYAPSLVVVSSAPGAKR